jgi:hypothetical protein
MIGMTEEQLRVGPVAEYDDRRVLVSVQPGRWRPNLDDLGGDRDEKDHLDDVGVA